ncbi:murein biosynthesis integral membrane protein MurJ [Nonomuraea sp. NPDC059194]|uniref:murein biosynthesis integral membrane protein MurJ n=1 Tax=Nonomuraea sp. NPDC059194 TaxID=3346764 RepID=UPI0036966E67
MRPTGRGQAVARGVAGAAVLIGAITILARITGFAKQYVFAQTVGDANLCLGTAYMTANQIPNIVFEVVVGGALAGMVVPVVASATDRLDVGRITSALLTWVLVVLVPLGVLTALLAGPIVGLFPVEKCGPAFAAIATRMLVVFAPQIPLYGLAVVLYGVLQSHHRFAGPAVAPLVSSIVVIVAYLLFVPLSAGETALDEIPSAAELALSVGTTLGVLSLVLTVIGPALGLGLRLRPTLRFPDGVAARVRTLAMAGVAALIAQQATMIVVMLLSNNWIGEPALLVYNYAWAIYLVPYAVLAVPVATSAFPGLSAHAADGSWEDFARLAARTTRAVVLISGLAAGALAAAAGPGSIVFLGSETKVSPIEMARTVALFAPGLIGYGLIAQLSRVLYAEGRGRAAATGTVAGWMVAMAAQTVFVLVLPDGWTVGGLALGMTVGMTVGGAWLLVAVRGGPARRAAAPEAGLADDGAPEVPREGGRTPEAGLEGDRVPEVDVAAGRASEVGGAREVVTGLGRGRSGGPVDGVARAMLAAVAGGGLGFLAGSGVVALLPAGALLAQAALAVLAGVVALGVGVLAVVVLDRPDAAALAAMVTRRRRAGSRTGGE